MDLDQLSWVGYIQLFHSFIPSQSEDSIKIHLLAVAAVSVVSYWLDWLKSADFQLLEDVHFAPNQTAHYVFYYKDKTHYPP